MKSDFLKWPRTAIWACILLISTNALFVFICFNKQNDITSIRDGYEQIIFDSFKTNALACSAMKEGRPEVAAKILNLRMLANQNEMKRRSLLHGRWIDLNTYIDNISKGQTK